MCAICELSGAAGAADVLEVLEGLDACLELDGDWAAPWGAVVGGIGKDSAEGWLADPDDWCAEEATGLVGVLGGLSPWPSLPSFARFFLRNPRVGI